MRRSGEGEKGRCLPWSKEEEGAYIFWMKQVPVRRRRGRDFMVVGFITIAYHHWRCEFESRPWRGVLDTTLCDKVCQWLVTGRWFSSGTPVSSTNKTNHHDITKILLKVALNTITITIWHSSRGKLESVLEIPFSAQRWKKAKYIGVKSLVFIREIPWNV